MSLSPCAEDSLVQLTASSRGWAGNRSMPRPSQFDLQHGC